ncbi:angiopoietin-related protein 7 isoform X1 [Anastrepha ludens]|uniref:angiopoietin-related protein 7 isoform X1 n=1 Tax=Anastrepha ludens TaxID=28586 RepID=UPI0023B1C6BC|nr:angiopoietin-related protein 7 isoform X1 [Anastrepha ludens]
MNFTSFFLAALLAVLLSDCAWCQQLPPQSFQTHPTRTNVTRWNHRHFRTSVAAPSSDGTSKNCENLLTNLHDRVSVLASLDEDLRRRLENIEKKMGQFESNNMGRLDSLAVQQADFLKRLDTLDYMERQTKRNIDELKGDLIHERQKEEIVLRTARDAVDRLPQMPTDKDRLDSLATLLLSTRSAVNELNNHLEANISKLSNMVSRRLSSIRRQNNRQSSTNFYATNHPTEPLATSCAQDAPTANGILRLQLTPESEPFYVRCDEETLGGGWTIIQNRFNGKLNFYRGWLEYQAGFGNLGGEFFIGLDKLHALTASAVHELLILLQDFDGVNRYARYNLFAIGSEKEDYALNLLGEYEGDAGDSLTYHAGSKFSTFDNDNDGCVDCNCAQSRNGAWWYNWCDMSNLNGKYFSQNYNNTPLYEGVYWNEFRGAAYSLKAVRMMIRPVGNDGDLQRK